MWIRFTKAQCQQEMMVRWEQVASYCTAKHMDLRLCMYVVCVCVCVCVCERERERERERVCVCV